MFEILGAKTTFFTFLFFYSFYAVKDAESEFNNKDPRQIVIDEVLGQAMPLILVLHLSQNNQLSLPIEVYYVLSFIFFRFFDISKIGPVGWVENNPKEKAYNRVIGDDIMAALLTIIVLIIFLSVNLWIL